MRNNSFFKFSSLFNRAFGAYRLQIGILAIVGFLSGLLEGIGINALVPLFSFVIGDGGADDSISQWIKNAFDFVNINFTLNYLLVFIALLFIFKAILLFVGSYIQSRITYDYLKNIRTELFEKTLRSKWRYLMEQKIGYLEKVLSVEMGFVAKLLQTTSSLVLIVTSLLIFLIVAVNISFSITAISLATGLTLIVVFQPLINKMRRLSQAIAEQSREIAHFVNENVVGMKTVKAMFSVVPVTAQGEKHFELWRTLLIKHSLLGIVFGSLFQPLSIIFVLVLFYFAYMSGEFSFPAFVAIVYLIQRIFSQIQGLQAHVQTILTTMPYVENMLAYQSAINKNKEEEGGDILFTLTKDFSFKNVSFTYQEGKEVLSGVSFNVEKGSFVGLIGPSGAGKTTIVDLVLRLLKPSAGDILLDDVSVSNIGLREWRSAVGYVSQDIHLVNDTVANNIRFFDETITDEEVKHAAKQAHIYDVIETLPQKFSSIVGERGFRLSAGQRQRVIIARILARKPQFLVLDEATSALDNESEKRIQEVIENLKGKMTVLVIAHRLGTVMNCGKLLVLQGGKIVEEGKPQELLKDKESYFFKMYNIRK